MHTAVETWPRVEKCVGLKDRESVALPVSKTGDSRFESWVPR